MWLSAAMSAMCQEIPAWNTMHGCLEYLAEVQPDIQLFICALNQLISRQSVLKIIVRCRPTYTTRSIFMLYTSSFYEITPICSVDLQIKLNQNKTLTCKQLTVLTGWFLVSVSFMDFSIHCGCTAGYTHSHCCLTD